MNLAEKMSNKFSRHEQLVKLIEELGECTTAASRLLRTSSSDSLLNIHYAKNLVEEIIDVEFLFDQMRYYLDGFVEEKQRNDREVEARFFLGDSNNGIYYQ